MNKTQQDDIYTCSMLEPKIFEFERFDQQSQATTPNGSAIQVDESQTQSHEYTIVQDHSHKISSSVWKYFGSLKKNDQVVDPNHVYCGQCFEDRKTKKYQKSTSTGNLLKHLKKAHHICLEAPQFRVKCKKDGIVVTKSEPISYDANVQYFDTTNGSYISVANGSQADSDSEYLVHDIHEILIAEVAKRPPIYDSSLCKKNKKQIRREMWSEIHAALNELVPLEKLPKVWKNIRDRYHKIKKDIERGSQTKPKYRYFHLLQFLDNVDHQKQFVLPTESSENFNTNYIMHNFDSEDVEQNVAIDADQPDLVHCTDDQGKEFEMDMNKFKSEHYYSGDENNEPSTKKLKLNGDETSNDDDVPGVEQQQQQQQQQFVEAVPITLTQIKQQQSSPVHQHEQQQQQHHHHDSCDELIDKTILTDQGTATLTVTTADCSLAPVLLTSAPTTITTTAGSQKPADEFDIFGNFVGQVMRNMSKSKARLLQMKVLQLITEFDE